MRVRLFDVEAAAELARHLRGRDFHVVCRDDVLSAHLRNHVSARYDRLKLREAVVEWVAAGGAAVLFEDEAAASAAVARRGDGEVLGPAA